MDYSCQLSIRKYQIAAEIASRLTGIVLVCFIKRCTMNINGRLDRRSHILKAYTQNEMFQTRVNRAFLSSLQLTFDSSSSSTQNAYGGQEKHTESSSLLTRILPGHNAQSSLNMTKTPCTARGIKRHAELPYSCLMDTTVVPVGQIDTPVCNLPASLAPKATSVTTTVITGLEKRKQKKLRT